MDSRTAETEAAIPATLKTASPRRRDRVLRWYMYGHLLLAVSPIAWSAVSKTGIWNEVAAGLGLALTFMASFLSILPAGMIALWIGCSSFVEGNYRLLLLFIAEIGIITVQLLLLLPQLQ
jgi:hypothetical protein